MHAYRFPTEKQADADALFNGQESIQLPFGKDAFLVFSAWQNWGKLPFSGGVLEQPRAFKTLLGIMNTLYEAADEDEVFMEPISPSTLPVDTAPRSFEDFMKRG